jgi:hypothetical protein
MQSPTSLIISELGIGWQSGLDIHESLKPIEAGELRRTVNGDLVNLTSVEFRRLVLRISSDDIRPPALSHLWRGDVLTVVPVTELGDLIPAGGHSRTLVRDPHPGSVRCLTLAFGDVPCTVDGRVVTLSSPAAEPARIYYRPSLTMMVSGWSVDESEAAASSSWSLDLEEI